MKESSKIISLLLAVAILFSLAVTSHAATDQVTLNMLCYNVAGLPSIGGVMGIQGADIPGNQKAIGSQLNGSKYDIIAVQEDFGYHKNLASELTAYPYQTIHSGNIPGGDGLNVFSKTPVYNEARTGWEKAFGVVKNGADELTPKGFLYTVIDIGNGIYIDLYTLHADAGKDEGSIAARNDNFRQLAEVIKAKNSDRPIIITGDFNTSSHLDSGKDFTKYLIDNLGFKDCWTELYNNGNYADYSEFAEKYGENTYRGNWDSIEKFLYKNGGGVTIEPSDFEYIEMYNGDVSASDHKSASVTMTFTKTADFKENTETLTVAKKNPLKAFLHKIKVIFADLTKLLSHVGDVFGLLK